MTLFCAICTLAVDYGRVQLIKTEMQRCADATARAYITYYMNSGKTYADSHIAAIYAQARNPVDSNSGTNPTVTVTFGSWNSGTNTFSASTGATPAVKVQVTRTAANSNAVPITWGGMLGKSTIDVHARRRGRADGRAINLDDPGGNIGPVFLRDAQHDDGQLRRQFYEQRAHANIEYSSHARHLH